MQLYIGGYAQGKLECVRNKYPGAELFDENNYNFLLKHDPRKGEHENLLILNHLHLIIRKLLRDGISIGEITDVFKKLAIRNSNIIFICDEVGNGIVPPDAFERTYREAVGKTQIALADMADEVWRVTCGIAHEIK